LLFRRKAIHTLLPGLSLRVAAVDAHELFATEHRCCAACRVRLVWKGKGEQRRQVTEYYHTVVVLELVGVEPRVVVDCEPIAPGEGEVAAATRLMNRALDLYSQLFDVVVADAAYAGSPFFKNLCQHGKEVIAVLKDERRELFADIAPMERRTPPLEWEEADGKRHIKLWDFEHLQTWEAIGRPVRVVHVEEDSTRRVRRGWEWKEEAEHHTWYWVTTLSGAQASGRLVRRLGHSRWDLENVLNELVNLWGMDHRFKHEPNAILTFLLTLFLAFAIVWTFYCRNVQPAVRRRLTCKAFSEQIAAMLTEGAFAHCGVPP
jgi:hypothetical protein